MKRHLVGAFLLLAATVPNHRQITHPVPTAHQGLSQRQKLCFSALIERSVDSTKSLWMPLNLKCKLLKQLASNASVLHDATM